MFNTKQKIAARKELDDVYNFSINTHRDITWDGITYNKGDEVKHPVHLIKVLVDEKPNLYNENSGPPDYLYYHTVDLDDVDICQRMTQQRIDISKIKNRWRKYAFDKIPTQALVVIICAFVAGVGQLIVEEEYVQIKEFVTSIIPVDISFPSQ